MSVLRYPVLAISALTVVTLGGCSTAAPEQPTDFPLLSAESAEPLSAPGTEFGLDEFGWVPSTRNYGDGGDVTYTVAVALRAVEPGTEADWPDLVENPDDFAGYTPVVLIVEQRVFGEVPEGYSPGIVDVYPVYADGEVAPFVVKDIGLGILDDSATCGYQLYATEAFDPIFQYCLIGAAEEGEIVGIRFDGQTQTAVFADESTPYYANPVQWRS